MINILYMGTADVSTELFDISEKGRIPAPEADGFQRLYFVYIVRRKTKQTRMSVQQNNAVFFIQKHLCTVKNTCMFRKTIVDCFCCV